MLESLGIIFIVSLIFAGIMKKINFPSLIGMIIAGIVLGPFCLNLIDEKLLSVSPEIRKIALVVILLRAGLSLDIKHIKDFGKSTSYLTVIPAACEMIVVALIAIFILKLNLTTSLLLATVIAAVSPAVVVPRMINLIEKGKGKIPQIVIASSSLEDVFVIIVFSIILSIATTTSFEFTAGIYIITGIIAGVVAGFVAAIIIVKVFRKFEIIDSAKVITLLSISFLFVGIEARISHFSSLLAIMVFAILIGQFTTCAQIMSKKFKEVWVAAEIILFVSVGASLNVGGAVTQIDIALLVISFGLVARSIGVIFSLRNSELTTDEKKFIIISFLPKATVQAAIAPVALSLKLSGGETILNIAVIAILITAPLGAFLIDKYQNKLI